MGREGKLRKECVKESERIESRNSQPEAVAVIEVPKEAHLIRFVGPNSEYDEGDDVDLDYFTDNLMSVLIEGDDMTKELIVDELKKERMQGKDYVGAWRFPASLAEGRHNVLHDPNPTIKRYKEDGTIVPSKSQHHYHAQVLCVKSNDFANDVRTKGGWIVSPKEFEEHRQ